MLFNSYFFILVFLPFTLVGYYISGRRENPCISHVFLLAVSLWFYAFANIYYLPVIIGSILLNYMIYLGFGKGDETRLMIRRILLAVAVTINLGILIYFKYYNFFIDSLNAVFRTQFSIREIILPFGISFMTFQQIAFMVDSYRNETENCNLVEYALFIAFFPHLMSGPIITHGDFLPLLRDPNRRKVDWDRFASGLYIFSFGLAKKVLVADVFGRAVDWGYGNLSELNAVSAVFISFSYTFQIYFDFSSYSEMAIGISRMLNLDLPVNFDSPYKAQNLIEFWDRWHMTLTRFLTRYLYIPLGGSRKGKRRTWINTMIVFLCSGFWHGASWTFVLWGGLHGLGLIWTKQLKKWLDRIPKVLNWLFTSLFVNSTWILFRAGSFGTARKMLERIFIGRWGMLNENIADCFSNVLFKRMTFLPGWAAAGVYLIGALVLIIACRNVNEMAETMKTNRRTGSWAVLCLLVSILSLSDVSTYIYAGF